MIRWDQQPMDEATRQSVIGSLCRQYPWLQVRPIGKSILGRELPALYIPTLPGTPSFHRPLLLTGAFHGMEWITASLLLRFTQTLCTMRQEGKYPFCRDCTVIPCVNPDGVEIQIHGSDAAGNLCAFVEKISGGDTLHWQANARGVDLNHNFDAKWHRLKKMEQEAGITRPAMTRFGGRAPESEPESRALAWFCRKNPFAMAVALHSQGEEIYYDFGHITPKHSLLLAESMAQVSGYRVASPTGLASYGGFKDWFLLHFRRPAFTIEVGKGENPLPLRDFFPIYDKVEAMLFTLLAAEE